MPACTASQGLARSSRSSFESKLLGVPTRYATPSARMSASVACVGMPRSITHTRRRFAVEFFDLRQEFLQRGFVGGIAGEHLIGQRQAVGGHHQGDHHLPAIRPAVARVAVFGLGNLRAQPLEVGAGQIV